MRYNHCGCNRLESVSAVVAGGVMTITTIPAQTFVDYKFYPFDVCLALPAHIGTEPTAISDGTNSYPLIDTNGQPVVCGKLRGHMCYRIRFGAGGLLADGTTMPAHFTVYDGLCCMEYSSNAALQKPAE